MYYAEFLTPNEIQLHKYDSVWFKLKTVDYKRIEKYCGWAFHDSEVYAMGGYGPESDSRTDKVSISSYSM